MAKLYVVGIGPGSENAMTGDAKRAIEESEIIGGYTVYVELVRKIYPDKEYFTTPMTKEIDRCRLALTHAANGRTCAMVCSGDAGVYGMAGPILQLLPEYPDVEVVVVPGLTAANSGAAVLGAPLTNDYCVISLSDALTPWPVIEKRLRAAAMGDFVTVLYNPSSRRRADYLGRACDILLESRSADTVCGWVRNIGREGQEHKIMTLGQLKYEQVDMFTTVFIGNSDTIYTDGYMVTGRGYTKL